MTLIPLWLSLSVHEWAHAWVAWRLGDDTARLAGRLTLNPLAHIDPVGTLLLPLLGVPFGWAKPVPVQPHRFHQGVNMRSGMMRVALAGPVSNLVLAALSLMLLMLLVRVGLVSADPADPIHALIFLMILVNVLLASFNALPIPPLDGSRVADALMPAPLRPAWEGFLQMGPLALVAVLILPRLTGVQLFYWPISGMQWVVDHALSLVQ